MCTALPLPLQNTEYCSASCEFLTAGIAVVAEPTVGTVTDDDEDDFPVGIIVAIVAAILAVLFIVLVVCVLCVQWCRSRTRHRKERIIDNIYADNRR